MRRDARPGERLPGMASTQLPVSYDDVVAAQSLIKDVVRRTPLESSRPLSDLVGGPVYLKCENLQRAGSFKIRGAYTRMSRLSDAERAAGVVAASAGNHAQGVALAAQMLGIKAKVYMPLGAPIPKLMATRGYGAEIEQLGQTIDDCLIAAREYSARTGAVLIHPFDHPDIVAGQGTVGLEILEQCPDVRTIIVGMGGGGLTAGIATAVKAHHPDVRIVGVQAERAAAYPQSLAAGRPMALERMATMADGIAVGCPGEVPYEIVAELVDQVATVSEEMLSRALVYLLERAKLVVEPAGAATVAAIMAQPELVEPPVVAVLSGGNIDPLLDAPGAPARACRGRSLPAVLGPGAGPARVIVRVAQDAGRGRRQRAGDRARAHQRDPRAGRGRDRGPGRDDRSRALRAGAGDVARAGLSRWCSADPATKFSLTVGGICQDRRP